MPQKIPGESFDWMMAKNPDLFKKIIYLRMVSCVRARHVVRMSLCSSYRITSFRVVFLIRAARMMPARVA